MCVLNRRSERDTRQRRIAENMASPSLKLFSTKYDEAPIQKITRRRL